MGPTAVGFRLVWDANALDAPWVVGPGVCLLVLAAACLRLRARASTRVRRACGGAGALLALGAVWWTLGGLGAWRAGVGRLATGTANFVEGTVTEPVRTRDGRLVAFRVQGLQLRRAPDAALAPLHAAPWPALALGEGQHVRVWFFDDDLLRLELADR